MTQPKLLPVLNQFGEPLKTVKSDNGTLQIWTVPPIVASVISGYGSLDFAMEIDKQYRQHYVANKDIVTVHDWSHMTDYDAAARKVLQVLNKDMQQKQRELVIHLGKADSLVQKVVRTTAETITRFRKLPIELYSDDDAFEQRVKELIAKY
ncbi:MAG: hypothetical protein JXR76_08410 [Deltaproteobacteria bacterium]|nr:hypothetical protein [Deltaproteobacteria bacterium]